jgi:ferredoxin
LLAVPLCVLPLYLPILPGLTYSSLSDYSGACEGSVACSTCHVILPEEYYNLLPEPEDDENDMLDMAFGLTDTSRLGCQVKVTRELDGITCTLPSATRNMFVDGMCLLFDISQVSIRFKFQFLVFV